MLFLTQSVWDCPGLNRNIGIEGKGFQVFGFWVLGEVHGPEVNKNIQGHQHTKKKKKKKGQNKINVNSVGGGKGGREEG